MVKWLVIVSYGGKKNNITHYKYNKKQFHIDFLEELREQHIHGPAIISGRTINNLIASQFRSWHTLNWDLVAKQWNHTELDCQYM